MKHNRYHFSLMLLAFFMLHVQGQVPPEIQLDSRSGRDLNVVLKGVNWFGFNNKQTMLDGLWIGGSSMATDFNTIVWRLKIQGFNAIRLPFTFDDVLLMKPADKRIRCSIVASSKEVHKSCVPPWATNNKNCSVGFMGVLPKGGVCNAYLDNTSVLARFVGVVKTFIDNGFYVILDYHPMNTEKYAVDVVAQKWAQVMQAFVKRSGDWQRLYKNRLIVDILNEPDSMRMGWKEAGSLYLTVMDKIWYSVTKDVFFMIEGTGQGDFNLNWGDGFVTNKTIIKMYGISDANWFFDAVVKKPYKDRVIVSPHMYGPSIAMNDRAHAGEKLRRRMWDSYGYLYDVGYKGKRFPIVLGEFGTFFRDPRDRIFFRDLARHWTWGKKHWFWWAYNNNSGDTGGLVKEDWITWEWDKIKYLRDSWGMKGKCW